jgi:hypothetical protein
MDYPTELRQAALFLNGLHNKTTDANTRRQLAHTALFMAMLAEEIERRDGDGLAIWEAERRAPPKRG